MIRKRGVRVVLDTSVIISSIFWLKGNPHKVVDLAIKQKIQNFTSAELLRELLKVLEIDFEQPEEYIQRQIALVTGYSRIIKPRIKFNIVKDDPKDNMVLDCAIKAKARYIITGDNHLLKLKEVRGIKIVTSKEFLDSYGLYNKS